MARFIRKSARPRECAIQREILEWLSQQEGIAVIKLIVANRAGYPDILCCVRGHFVSLEVKREGEDASPLQHRRIAEIRNADGYAEVVSSLEETKRIVEPLLEKKV